MKTSEQIEKVSAALVKAQAAIKPAIKDSTNPHFKSKYADLTAVWDAIHQAMTDNDLALIQLPVHSEDGRVHLTTRVLHSSGQWLEETASIPVAKQDAHGYGSGLTYLRRYSGVAALFVPTEDDDGNAAASEPAAAKWSDRTAKHGSNGAEVCQIAFDQLPPDEQVSMKLHASIMLEMSDTDAVTYMRSQKIVGEDKLALWHLLPATRRAGIKKIEVANPTTSELATQA